MAQLKRRTRRLEIRPLTARDYLAWKTAYFSMKSPQNNWDHGNRKSSELTLEKFRALLRDQNENQKADRIYDFAVFRRDTRELIGSVGIMDVIRGVGQSAYFGYAILNRHWNLGYGKEASLAAIDIVFKDLRLHRIEAGIQPGNRRSILLARSLGLRKEGLKKRAILLNGRWVDLLIYAGTCEDFGVRWKGRAINRLR